MSSGSHLELANETHELKEHEYTLDGDELELAQATTVRRLRATPPPPPPPRSQRAVSHVGHVGQAGPQVPNDRIPRNVSGVFSIEAAAGALGATEPVSRAAVPPPAPPSRALADAQLELARVRAQMRARDAYLAELESALEDHRRQLAAAGLASFDDLAQLLGRVRGQAFRVAELESELRRMAALEASEASGPDNPQHVQSVRGIGPRFAKQLHASGVVSVDQIAAWTDADCARMAAVLRISASRIVRERWIEQARALVTADQSADQSVESNSAPRSV
jgi:predicted flap endonuclease-1-like 5' DNA nuclease